MEGKYDFYDDAPYDEYNEFDRNGDANDASDTYRDDEKLRLKLLREPYNKENERLLISLLKSRGWEDTGYLYDELNHKYPTFKKYWENEYSYYGKPRIRYPKTNEIPSYGDDPYKTQPGNRKYVATVNDTDYDSRELAAYRGLERGNDNSPSFNYNYNDYYSIEDLKNRTKNPKNDINQNIYDRQGVYAMDVLSDDELTKQIGKSVRSTMRDTYKAAKKNRQKRQKILCVW